MKTTKIFTPVTITIAIVSVIVGGFCGLFLAQAEENMTKEVETYAILTKNPPSSFQEAEKDTKNFNKALYYTHLKTCENIADAEMEMTCKNTVFMQGAIQEQKKELCEKIANEEMKQECQDAIQEKIAYTSGDKKLCTYIINPTLHNRCKENIDTEKIYNLNNEPQILTKECQGLEDKFQKICLEKVRQQREEKKFFEILKQKDPNQCQQLENPIMQNNCQDSIFEEIAKQEETKEWCEKVKNPYTKSYCLQNVNQKINQKIIEQAVQEKNILLCGEISDEYLGKKCNDTIILKLVQESKNTSLCGFLQIPEHQNICKQIIDF